MLGVTKCPRGPARRRDVTPANTKPGDRDGVVVLWWTHQVTLGQSLASRLGP